MVSGVGSNPEAARRHALECAVRAALGDLLDPALLAQHDALLRERILWRSDQFVAVAEMLGKPRVAPGAFSEALMRVSVRLEPLREALREAGLSLARLDGRSRLAAEKTREESREDAAAILAEKLVPLPAALVRASAEVGGARHAFDGESMRIELPILVEPVPEAYASFVADLNATLEKLGFTRQIRNRRGGDSFALADFGARAVGEEGTAPHILAVCEVLSREGSRWSDYQVPKQAAAVFRKDSGLAIKTELLDAFGQVVTSRVLPLGGDSDKDGRNNLFSFSSYYGFAYVAPRLAAPGVDSGTCLLAGPGKDGSGPLRRMAVFTLSLDELRRTASVRCSVINAAQQ